MNLGAGLMFFCNKEVLLLKRSSLVNQPGTWGNPGGYVGNTFLSLLEEANRECLEELGSIPEGKIFDVVEYQDPNFKYVTFLKHISTQTRNFWEIKLNWEHQTAKWFSIDCLPTPLHPGIEYIVSSRPDLFSN